MAKKEVKSLAEKLKSSAYIWLGNTNIDGTRVLLFTNHNNILLYLIEEDEETIVLKSSKDNLKIKGEVFKILYEVYPDWKKLGTGNVETSKLPKGLSITSDCNEDLFAKSIKPLKESTVKARLEQEGINISLYNYTKLTVDNSHTLTKASITSKVESYPEEVQKHFKDVSKYKDYEVDKKDEFTMLDAGCYLGIIAAGPAGTGKTTDFFTDSAQKDIPVIDFQCLHNTESEDLFGKFIPKEEGGFVFIYGPLALAAKYDTRMSIQEFNYAPTAVQSALNSFMDDNGTMTLPNGEVIERGPNFRLFLTVNPGYRGTNMFNPATLNRFATVYYPPITKEVLIARLQKETGYKNTKVLETIADKFDKLRDIFESKNMETEITYRNVSRFLKMILLAPEVSIEKQFDMAFVNNAVFEMNDIPTELQDLKDISKEYIKEIKDALADGTEEVQEASFDFKPEIDMDELTAHIGEDGSFLDDDEEDE